MNRSGSKCVFRLFIVLLLHVFLAFKVVFRKLMIDLGTLFDLYSSDCFYKFIVKSRICVCECLVGVVHGNLWPRQMIFCVCMCVCVCTRACVCIGILCVCVYALLFVSMYVYILSKPLSFSFISLLPPNNLCDEVI